MCDRDKLGVTCAPPLFLLLLLWFHEPRQYASIPVVHTLPLRAICPSWNNSRWSPGSTPPDLPYSTRSSRLVKGCGGVKRCEGEHEWGCGGVGASLPYFTGSTNHPTTY